MSADRYGLDPRFERGVVALACGRPEFWSRIGHALDPEGLGSKPARLAIKAARACAAEHGHGPSSLLIVLQRLRRWMGEGKVTLDEIEAVAELFDEGDAERLPAGDGVIAELLPVLQRQMQRELVKAAAVNLARHEGVAGFAAMGDLLRRAEGLGAPVAQGLGLVVGSAEGFAAIRELRTLEKLPTGVLELDGVMCGGFPRGLLGMFLGSTAAGKSMALAHLAAEAIWHGLHACYATLELPAAVVLARVKANLTGETIDAIMAGGAGEERCRAALAEMDTLGICRVQDFAANATSPQDVFAWVIECERVAGKECDLLVVDYGCLLTVPSEQGDYRIAKRVWTDLLNWSKAGRRWCVTAAQARRKIGGGKSKGGDSRAGNDDVADSMNKTRIANVVVSINRSSDESDPRYEFFVAKNTLGPASQVATVEPELACGRIGPVVRSR